MSKSGESYTATPGTCGGKSAINPASNGANGDGPYDPSPDSCGINNEPELVGVVERRFTHETGPYFVDSNAASTQQVGGDHYKDMVIQPSEFIYRNKLNWLVGNAIKYLCRYDKKGGRIDLAKARHYIRLLEEWEYERDGQDSNRED